MSQSLRWVASALLILVVTGPASAGIHTLRELSQKTVDPRGLNGIRVENARGAVMVRASGDGLAHLTASKVVRERDEQRARRFAARTQVVVSTESGWWTVRVHYPQNESISVGLWQVLCGFELPRVEVQLELEVPAGFATRLRSTSGDLSTEGVSGPQKLETTSGSVTVQSARGSLEATSVSGDIVASHLGPARLRTVSGDLRVDDAAGPLSGSTSSGDIAVKGAGDSLVLSSSSGSIRVSAAPKGLAAKSTSGDVVARAASRGVRVESTSGAVSVGLEGPLRFAEIATGSGDIVASLARSLSGALEMRTASGTLEVAVPLEVGTVTRHLVTGVIGGGTAPIRLRTSSGSIEVRSGGER